MLKIGEFVKITGISINMLRNYDSIGLLKPAKIDDFTGYRYYDEKQIILASRIAALKNAGFSLSDIKNFNILDDKDKIKELIEATLLKKEKEKKEVENQILLLKNSLVSIEADKPYFFTANLKVMSAMYIATYQGVITKFSDEGVLWEHLYTKLTQKNIEYDLNPFNFTITNKIDIKNNLIDESVNCIVNKKYADFDDITFSLVPERLIYSLPFSGKYSNLGNIYAYMEKEIKRNNYCRCGNSFLLYYVSPKNTNDENSFVSEVCIPVKKL